MIPFSYLCYIENLAKNGPVVLEKKLIILNCMLNNDGCLPIAIGHLSYSGDLKITLVNFFYYLISDIHIALQIIKSEKAWCQKMLLSVRGRRLL